MNNQTSLSRYILVILCVSIVFTTLVLIAFNSWLQNKRLANLSSGIPGLNQLTGRTFEDGYKAGFLSARDKYKSMPPLPEGIPVQNLTGTINSVDSQKITLTAKSLDTDEIVDGVSNVRTVLIDASTSVVLRVLLTSDEMAKKMNVWSKSADRDKMSPPSPYLDKAIKFSDLKPNQTVSVMAKEDIRLKETFTASQIILTQNSQ